MTQWDPDRYLTYADERGRPFADLLARVHAVAPTYVVDLGCGPGNLTAGLNRRWPGAEVRGVDASAAMIDRAYELSGERLTFEQADLRDWAPARPVDVLVSNATLQWVDGHRELLPSLVDALAPDGWLAFQVPGNFEQPSHALLHGLAADPRFAAATARVEPPSSHDPDVYLDDLLRLGGLDVDAWETTYLHVLTGQDPVFTWISGTGARPVLQALDETSRAEFVAEYTAMLREAYPPTDVGTVLPFRRVFVVAHKVA